MGQGLGIGEVIDGDNFQIRVAQRGAQHGSPDTAKPIDSYSNSHITFSRSVRTNPAILGLKNAQSQTLRPPGDVGSGGAIFAG
jgi:hypothetical protein